MNPIRLEVALVGLEAREQERNQAHSMGSSKVPIESLEGERRVWSVIRGKADSRQDNRRACPLQLPDHGLQIFFCLLKREPSEAIVRAKGQDRYRWALSF